MRLRSGDGDFAAGGDIYHDQPDFLAEAAAEMVVDDGGSPSRPAAAFASLAEQGYRGGALGAGAGPGWAAGSGLVDGRQVAKSAEAVVVEGLAPGLGDLIVGSDGQLPGDAEG